VLNNYDEVGTYVRKYRQILEEEVASDVLIVGEQ